MRKTTEIILDLTSMPGSLYCANMGSSRNTPERMLSKRRMIGRHDIHSMYEAAQRIDNVFGRMEKTTELRIILSATHVDGLIRDGILEHFRSAEKKADRSEHMASLEDVICRKNARGEKDVYEIEVYGDTDTVLAALGAYIKQKYPNEKQPLTHIAPQIIDELVPCRRI